jgi:signal transduction histidine kinase
MKSQFEEIENALEASKSSRPELVQTRRELDECRDRLAQVDEQLQVYKKAETLLQGQKHLTKMIARGDALEAILEDSCKLVENALQGSLAVIMIRDGKRLRRGAAPSLRKYIAEVDGFDIGPDIGTCSAAAARGVPVITPDITKDPNWVGLLDLAARHGLRAGWATPIISPANQVLGTFALYWPEPRGPTPHHLQIVNQMAQLVAFAIERKQAAEALQASEKLARGQAEALTLTLDAVAKETDPGRAMEHVLRTVTAQLNAHSCSVWLRDQVSGLMVFEFALEDGIFKTRTEAKLAAVSPSLAVEAIPTWAEMFRAKRPIVLEDIRIKPDFPWRAHLLGLGVITMLAVPMVIAGKGEGLIGIRFTRKRTFSAGEQELAQVLANQAMLAIQLARLSGQSRQTAIVEERNRMARDIHDTLAQGFTGVIAQLEAARGAMSRKKMVKVSDHLERAGEMARESLREARRSVQALRPLALEEKLLTTALRDLMKRMTTGMTMKAKLALKGKPSKLPPEWETNFLRIGQEVLTNAIRHAEASQFDALLVFGSQDVRVSFQDNGRGFDLEKANGGFGIQGIRERVQEMGGKFSIQTAKGKGTTIALVVPSRTVSRSEKL